MKARICLMVQWRCQECGHQHKQMFTIAMPQDLASELDRRDTYSLACKRCGWESPLVLSLNGLADIAVKAPENIKVQLREHGESERLLSNIVRSAKRPSPN